MLSKPSPVSSGRLLAAFVLGGLALRLYGVAWGLPALFNGDEPHVINLAVSFSSGDLNPHMFKYPTLWMYVLFAAFGVFFAAWSGLGLRRSVSDFGGLFAWKPAPFYLIARLLSVLLSCLGAAVVGRTDLELAERRGQSGAWFPWAALFLALSPNLIYSCQGAKAEGLMFLLAALAWRHGLAVYQEGRPRDYLLTGAFTGLAFASLFTALPLFLVLPLAHALRWRRDALRPSALAWLAGGCAAAGLAFFIGSPYVVLDWRTFVAGSKDLGGLYALARPDHWALFKRIAAIGLWQAGAWSLGGVAMLRGAWLLAVEEPALLGLLAGPFLAFGAFMCTQVDGGVPRYFFACFPALALLSAAGARDIFSRAGSRGTLALLAAWALLPGLAADLAWGRHQSLPDTRHAAKAWIESHVPAGSGILLDQLHASPDLVMDRGRVEELLKQNAALGSRRTRYYELLLRYHPGGGFRIFRVQRSAADLWSPPAIVERAQKEGPYLDVRPGLAALRAKGISYVVTSELGADPSRAPEFKPFFDELAREGKVLAEFRADNRTTAGPLLKVYQIPK